MNCELRLADWLVVTGAGGGLGHLAGKKLEHSVKSY